MFTFRAFSGPSYKNILIHTLNGTEADSQTDSQTNSQGNTLHEAVFGNAVVPEALVQDALLYWAIVRKAIL